MVLKRAEESIEWLRPPDVVGAEVLLAQNCARGWHYFHERYAVSSCRAAASGWRYRGRDHFLSNGTTAFMEPGEVHFNTVVQAPQDFTVLFIDSAVLNETAREAGLTVTPHFRIAQTQDHEIRAAVEAFGESVLSDADVLERQTCYLECIRLILGYTETRLSIPNELRADRIVRQVKSYLHENYRHPVSLDALATVTAVSRFHLVHAFTRRVGIPPHAYHVRIRVEHARRMLLAGMSAAVVAAELGFADQSHLTRHFVNTFGVPPGSYAWGAFRRGGIPLSSFVGSDRSSAQHPG